MELANHSNCKFWPGKPYEESKVLSPYRSFLGQLEHLNPIRLGLFKKQKTMLTKITSSKCCLFLKVYLFQIICF